jgi:hypothetical protein
MQKLAPLIALSLVSRASGAETSCEIIIDNSVNSSGPYVFGVRNRSIFVR